MMKLWEVFRFEVGHQLRRRSVWLYVGALLALVFHMVREMTTGENGDILINAPAALFEYISLAGLFGLVVTAALAGDAATRDVRARIEPLLYTAPVGKWALLGGRFLGVLVLNALLLVVATGVVALAVHTSDAAPERLGPFRAAAYLGPLVIVALPNVFIGSVAPLRGGALEPPGRRELRRRCRPLRRRAAPPVDHGRGARAVRAGGAPGPAGLHRGALHGRS